MGAPHKKCFQSGPALAKAGPANIVCVLFFFVCHSHLRAVSFSSSLWLDSSTLKNPSENCTCFILRRFGLFLIHLQSKNKAKLGNASNSKPNDSVTQEITAWRKRRQKQNQDRQPCQTC